MKFCSTIVPGLGISKGVVCLDLGFYDTDGSLIEDWQTDMVPQMVDGKVSFIFKPVSQPFTSDGTLAYVPISIERLRALFP